MKLKGLRMNLGGFGFERDGRNEKSVAWNEDNRETALVFILIYFILFFVLGVSETLLMCDTWCYVVGWFETTA
jgi:hypothetical protein